MTALELAQDLGYKPLYSILSPIIFQPVPQKTLEALQQRFHELIKNDLEDRVEREYMYLPVLEVLTELEVPQMWFPVKFAAHDYSSAVSFEPVYVWVEFNHYFRVMYIVLMAVSLW